MRTNICGENSIVKLALSAAIPTMDPDAATRTKKRRYKEYVTNPSVPIPRRTFFRKRKALGLVKPRQASVGLIADHRQEAEAEPGDKDMYPGARVSVKENIAEIMALVDHHKSVTKASLADQIRIMKSALPENVEVPRHLQSHYKFCQEKRVCTFYCSIAYYMNVRFRL